MKKIIPFKKQIIFNSNVEEIISISLEHTLLPTEKNLISGDFIVSGEYKMTTTSVSTDPFEFYIPCDIELGEQYKLDKVQINIDDFYYELINSKVLEVNIDVLIDKLEEEDIINEIPIKYSTMEELAEDLDNNNEIEDTDSKVDNDIKDNTLEDRNNKEVMSEKEDDEIMKDNIILDEGRCIDGEEYTKSIFSNFNDSDEEYRTYKVYIVREGDSLDTIISKYQINKEELEKYNDLKELSIGDKIIIPYYEDNK